MELLYLLEKLRMPGLNEMMLLITQLGEETAFLVIALVIFWCVDKKQGYYLMAVGFFGTMVNQFLKLLCRVPRPWVLDPDFTILEQAREAAGGYSFPSGHTQMSVGTFGGLAYLSRKSRIRWLWIGLAVLVPFSRMYIGVHTPADVFASVGIALGLVYALRRIAFQENLRMMNAVLLGMIAAALALLAFVECYPWLDQADGQNLASGMKNAYTMLGCTAGTLAVFHLERKYVNFTPKAPFFTQVLKVVLGLALVIGVKSGLKAPLEAAFGLYPGRMVRYFLIVLTAGFVWPLIFMRIGAKQNELRND